MSLRSIQTLLVITLVGLLGIPSASFGTDEAPSPSELHRMMGKQKAANLERARAMQRYAAQSAASTQTNYDVTWYDVSVRVNDTTEWLYGTVTCVASATEDGVTDIEVDLSSVMAIDQIVAPSGTLGYTRSGDLITLTLDQTYNAGEQFEFEIEYNGHPAEGGLQAFSFGLHGGAPTISSLSEPYFARSWWPCKDRMDDKPDSMGIHIEVETSLYCASNGSLDSIVAGGAANSRTFHYTVRYPIATYLFSVAIAPFVVWEQEYYYNDGADVMPIVHHVYSDWYNHSLGTWGMTPDILEILSNAFGPYPFLNEKYGHANFEWGGGMEHQTCTSMMGASFGFWTPVVVHEAAHQWWGDMITCKSWMDIWLNEGWASYAEAAYELSIGGWDDYHTYMNGMAYKGSGSVWCSDTNNVYRIFNGGLSYDKGAWLVHMLRGALGETAFATGLEAYYNSEHQYGAATTQEFKIVWENATGVDLDWFVDDWYYGTYYPKYEYHFLSEPAESGGYVTYLMVAQLQTSWPLVFNNPVDFYFDFDGAIGDTLTLEMDKRKEIFIFNTPNLVNHIELDPAKWILRDVFYSPWEMFIISLPEEISSGQASKVYRDTILVKGGVGPNSVDIIGGALPPGLGIANTGVIVGTPTAAGSFDFRVRFVNVSTGYEDQENFTIDIEEAPCCTGKTGNADVSPGDDPTIGDVVVLTNMLFINKLLIDCFEEGDVNQSGGIAPTVDDVTIGDIAVLIDFLFITGPTLELPDCF